MGFLKSIYHFLLAWLGGILYGRPSRRIFVLGVTGTKGKSTVVELINSILEAAGEKTALLSSVRVKIGSDSRDNLTDNTMPGRFFIQRFLREAVNVGCAYAIIEVTSEGVRQYRHRFIDFDAALFLNLRAEHIESHGSFERYRDAKVDFFRDVAERSKKHRKIFVVNKEDPTSEYFTDAVSGRGEIVYFSREEFIAVKLGHRRDAIGDWLGNDFNLENASAAAKFAETQGVSWDTIRKALGSFNGLIGRMDVIQRAPFKVIVDYAHTPDSLAKVYETLASGNSKLICVFGSAGGGRDKWKRPVMGGIAAKYCGEIVLTEEDSYEEKTEEILNQIEEGIREYARVNSVKFAIQKIGKRKDAIKKAIGIAKEDDVVIITGKGSEHWIHGPNGTREPWDERKAAKEALAMRAESSHNTFM